MYIFLFVCSLLTPLTMILLGKKWSKNPPKDISNISGYRTTMSMLNQDTWSYAHKYYGKLNFVLGIVLIIVTIAFMICVRQLPDFEAFVTCLVFLQLLIMIFTIAATEIKLNKVFTKTGRRR